MEFVTEMSFSWQSLPELNGIVIDFSMKIETFPYLDYFQYEKGNEDPN